jgi:hypothetical protein
MGERPIPEACARLLLKSGASSQHTDVLCMNGMLGMMRAANDASREDALRQEMLRRESPDARHAF